MMKLAFTLSLATAATLAAAAPDPLITPRAELAARQDDPALLGFVDATNGQFSDQRSCDFPATLSTSGNLAQCCSGSDCVFWQSCSAGTLFAGSTSLRCDQGFCNTAVIVPTVGASSGQDYLGCWATSLGESAFTIIRDIGSAPVASASSGSGSSGSSASGSRTTSAASSGASTGTSGASPAASSSTGAAVPGSVQPLTGVFGLVAMFLGMM